MLYVSFKRVIELFSTMWYTRPTPRQGVRGALPWRGGTTLTGGHYPGWARENWQIFKKYVIHFIRFCDVFPTFKFCPCASKHQFPALTGLPSLKYGKRSPSLPDFSVDSCSSLTRILQHSPPTCRCWMSVFRRNGQCFFFSEFPLNTYCILFGSVSSLFLI